MKALLIFGALFLILPYSICASYITLTTLANASEDSIFISITNNGDEPAYNTQIILDAIDHKSESQLQEMLEVGESFNVTFPLIANQLFPGGYPAVITTHYNDANTYPYSAISTLVLNYQNITRPNLALSLPSIDLSGSKKKLKLTIRNLDEFDKQVNVRVVAPKEFSITDKQLITVKGKDTERVDFTIKDVAARPGSDYEIFAIVDYDYENKHYTTITRTNVKIVSGLNIPTHLLILSLLILVALFVGYKVYAKNESKPRNSHTK